MRLGTGVRGGERREGEDRRNHGGLLVPAVVLRHSKNSGKRGMLLSDSDVDVGSGRLRERLPQQSRETTDLKDLHPHITDRGDGVNRRQAFLRYTARQRSCVVWVVW